MSAKSSTLGQQVKDAQLVVSAWSPEKRATVQLEGAGISRHPPLQPAVPAPPTPMTLGQQVRDAQRVVAGWSPERRAAVQIEGLDIHRRPAAGKSRGMKP